MSEDFSFDTLENMYPSLPLVLLMDLQNDYSVLTPL